MRIGALLEGDDTVVNFVKSTPRIAFSQKRIATLEIVRGLLSTHSFSTVEVGEINLASGISGKIDPGKESGKGQSGKGKGSANGGLAVFPKCCISMSTKMMIEQVEQLLDECGQIVEQEYVFQMVQICVDFVGELTK